MSRRWPWQPPAETGVVDTTWLWIEERWQDAIEKAIGFYQAGRRGRAEYELVRAALSIARLLDDEKSAEDLGGLVLIEIAQPTLIPVPVPGGVS